MFMMTREAMVLSRAKPCKANGRTEAFIYGLVDSTSEDGVPLLFELFNSGVGSLSFLFFGGRYEALGSQAADFRERLG